MNGSRLLKPLSVFIVSTLITGCASVMQKQQLNGFEKQLQSGQVAEATNTAVKLSAVKPETGKPTDILWSLQAGSLLRTQGEYAKSTEYFDDAEAIMKMEDTESTAENIGEGIGSLIINDSALAYEQSVYDGIMANTYKAMNFVAEDDIQNARIEWNRVDDRQRRAANEFSKQISTMKESQQEQEGDYAKLIGKSLEESNKVLEANGFNTSDWAPYKDYVNPFSTYMHGLFFMLYAQTPSDYSKAYDSMKRAYGMSSIPAVKTDLGMARDLMNGTSIQRYRPAVWVIYENGLSVKKKEVRIDLPLFLVSDDVLYTGVALPKLEEREGAWSSLQVGATRTESVASMDKIIQAEFKAELPYVVAKEITRATLKTVAQSKASEQSDSLAQVAAIFQAVTTSADTRMWTSLPKDFQIARIRKTSDQLTLKAEGMAEPIKVQLDKDSRFSVVYVRAFSANQSPMVEVINI